MRLFANIQKNNIINVGSKVIPAVKIVLLILLMLSPNMLSAQQKNGFYADFSAGFSNERENEHTVQFTPGLGYKFSERWAGGLRATLQTGDRRYNNFVAYARYSFANTAKLSIYTEAMLNWCVEFDSNDYDNLYGNGADDSDNFEGGLTFGACYNFTQHFGVFVNAFYIGYSNTPIANEGAVIGNGRFIVDANWRRAALGVRFTF